jgi:hypothetical protein
MKKLPRAIIIVIAIGGPGCQSLRINKEDPRGLKGAKVAGRVVQGVATGWLSEAYYAGQRARR